MRISQVNKEFMNEIHDAVDAVLVLVPLDLERNRNKASTAQTPNFSPATIDATMLGQLSIMSRFKKILELIIQR